MITLIFLLDNLNFQAQRHKKAKEYYQAYQEINEQIAYYDKAICVLVQKTKQ